MDRRFFLRLAAMTAASGLVHWRFAGAAPEPDPAFDTDVVVIGAGLGGLSCAAHLAKNGFRVLVLEQHSRPGGYATSFTRGVQGRTFTCEVSLHASVLGSAHMRAMLQELGVWNSIERVPHPYAWCSRFPGFSLDVPAKAGLDGFERQLAGLFPDEAQGLRAYFDVWRGVMAEMAALETGKVPREQFPRLCPNLWFIRDKTLAQVLEPHVRNPRLKAVLGQSCGYYGLPPSRLAAFYYLLPTAGYLEDGGDYLKGTSQSLSDALAAAIRQAGGEVRTRSPVTGVLLRDGRAAGVRLADGREIRSRAVVCNAAALELLRDLLPPHSLPPKTEARMESLTPSPGCCIVWLGLDRDLSTAWPRAQTTFYASEDMETDFARAMACDFEHSGFSVMYYDALVPGFSPKGCSSLGLVSLCGYDHWKPFEADYLAGRKRAYQAEKKRLTDLLVRRCEDLALPGLSKMIVLRESSTPLTNLRFTRNPLGAIYGFAPTADNAFMSRLPNATGLAGLYLASAWGDPGGGYAGALLGGKKAFRDVARELAGR